MVSKKKLKQQLADLKKGFGDAFSHLDSDDRKKLPNDFLKSLDGLELNIQKVAKMLSDVNNDDSDALENIEDLLVLLEKDRKKIHGDLIEIREKNIVRKLKQKEDAERVQGFRNMVAFGGKEARELEETKPKKQQQPERKSGADQKVVAESSKMAEERGSEKSTKDAYVELKGLMDEYFFAKGNYEYLNSVPAINLKVIQNKKNGEAIYGEVIIELIQLYRKQKSPNTEIDQKIAEYEQKNNKKKDMHFAYNPVGGGKEKQNTNAKIENSPNEWASDLKELNEMLEKVVSSDKNFIETRSALKAKINEPTRTAVKLAHTLLLDNLEKIPRKFRTSAEDVLLNVHDHIEDTKPAGKINFS